MAKALTTKAIENMKPGAARREIPDGGCRGLYCVVQARTRAKSWSTRFGLDGRRAKHPLGSSPAVSLAGARGPAAAALAQVAQGVAPRLEKRLAKAEAAERGRDTIDRLA